MSTEPAIHRVGLIGLGLMGRGMGLSLSRAGFELGVLAHRQRATAEEPLAAGAWEARSPAGLAEHCDAVVCCLPSAEVVRSVVLGEAVLAAAARPGLLVIDCSTLMPAVAVELQDRLTATGMAFVDAPVTRGPTEALAGRLNALVGGMPAGHHVRG